MPEDGTGHCQLSAIEQIFIPLHPISKANYQFVTRVLCWHEQFEVFLIPLPEFFAEIWDPFLWLGDGFYMLQILELLGKINTFKEGIIATVTIAPNFTDESNIFANMTYAPLWVTQLVFHGTRSVKPLITNRLLNLQKNFHIIGIWFCLFWGSNEVGNISDVSIPPLLPIISNEEWDFCGKEAIKLATAGGIF